MRKIEEQKYGSRLAIISLFVAYFLCGSVYAQLQDVKFERMFIRDGLSQSYITKIMQDNQGYMWLGTQDGLNRFDGYEFTKFYHNPNDSNSLSDNYIYALYQDKFNFVWIGTDNGICKYNQLSTEITQLHYRKTEKHLRTLGIRDIIDVGEHIWIATSGGGIMVVDPATNEMVKHIHMDNSLLTSNNIYCFEKDANGLLWIGTENNGLQLYNPTTYEFTTYAHVPQSTTSLCNDIIWTLKVDAKSNLWVGTNNGLSILPAGSSQFTSYSQSNSKLGNNVIKHIYEDSEHNIWIGSEGGGLDLVSDAAKGISFTNFSHTNYLSYSLSDNRVQQIYEDATGTIWIGTNNGLNKFDVNKQSFKHYQNIPNNENCLNNNTIWSIYEDHSGYLWVGTRKGLNRISPDGEYEAFENISKSAVFQNNKSVFSIYETSDHVMYAGTSNGLFKINIVDEKVIGFENVPYHEYYRDEDVLNKVYNIFEDSKKNLWIGTKNGLVCITASGKKQFISHDLDVSSSISGNTIRSIHEDQSGTIWIGTEHGLNKLLSTDSLYKFKHFAYSKQDNTSLSNNMVLSIWEDAGILWLGTYGGGLNRFDPDKETFEHYTDEHGLTNNVIYGTLGDDMGNLWLSTNRGLAKFNIKQETFSNYGEADGLQSDEFNIGASYISGSGQLFFGGINGLNSFYPADVHSNELPPKIVITSINIHNQKLSGQKIAELNSSVGHLKKLTLDFKQDNLTIEFAGLHYTYPNRNNYKYKLVGQDEEWQNIGIKRAASYTNLAPGDYTFIVEASNCDGVWGDHVATFEITITPPFWKTWWFMISASLFIVLSIIGALRARVKIIKDQKKRLELEVTMRTAEVMKQKQKIELQKEELQIEKDKSEKLLLNILPQETVDELKTKGKTKPRSYRTVTVMFTDFKNFTSIAESMRPKELVQELDNYFIKYDEIIEQHNIEKIKTIGDSYMAAGGIPIRNKSNPIDMVLAGLSIQSFMHQLKKERGEEAWEIRLGIHTGELIAGVVGMKRFAYDIWGNTVNVANRMEMTGSAGKVNISEQTYKHIKSFFQCTDRGEVQTKNMGMVKMYFVDRILPELSEDEAGIIPNKMFWEYVNLKLYSSLNYRKAEKYILKLLTKELSPELTYHDLRHTQDVCNAIERIATAEDVHGEDLFLLKTAALYHDAGFVEEYFNNEPVGARMAREILPKFGYDPEQIAVIERLILATKVPQEPVGHLEQIICDADLDYLGRNDFEPISDGLRKEFIAHGVVADDRAWDELQVKFLSAHTYFTAYSKKHRQKPKMAHLVKVKKRLKEDNY